MHLAAFIRQKPYERVVHRLRRHPITFLPKIILLVVLLSLPWALSILLRALFPAAFSSPILFPILVLSASIYLLSILIFFYTAFTQYYLDLWIVTNDRILDVNQLGLFSRTIAELELFRIQDATADVSGVFATFFDYGNVTVKTASSNAHLVFYNIPHPNAIRGELINLSQEDAKYHQNSSAPVT